MAFRVLILLSLLAVAGRAQLAPPTNAPIIGARQPALSPDGQRLAFVFTKGRRGQSGDYREVTVPLPLPCFVTDTA